MVDQAEIHRKVTGGDVEERREAAEQLSDNFADLPDKDEAWKDLIRLTGYEDSYLILRAVDALGSAFRYVPDKDEAWEDLDWLTRNEDSFVRWRATDALGYAFQYVPDKDAAWNDLHRLTWDANGDVRSGAADVLGSAFQYVPGKDAVWKDLIRLIRDEDTFVQWRAADALGSAFQYVPDKDVAWEDLHRLTGDKNSNVRAYANHLLGRASIFKATEAESEDNFESELKNAIDFFERSSKEATYYNNPSSFCLPFYRAFSKITFEKAGSEGEVKRYLTEAKNASEGSKNKEALLEAVENLANALSEAQKVTDFDATKSDLKAYLQYCNRAEDLIGDATEDAPGVAQVLLRRFPRINDQTKELIPEIQETAEAVCRETRGTSTPYESLGMEVNKWAGELSNRDYLRNERTVSRIINVLEKCCNHLPEGDKEYLCNIVKEIREESEHRDKLSDILTVLSHLEPCIRSQLQIATKPATDKPRSYEQSSQKTDHNTTVFAGAGSNVTVTQKEKESGDVTVNTAVTKESQPDKQSDRSSKRTAIDIFADIAVHVLVYTVLHYFAEDLMPVIAPILVLSALIILILIILNAKSG